MKIYNVVLSEKEYDFLMTSVLSPEEGYSPSKDDEIIFTQLIESLNGAVQREED